MTDDVRRSSSSERSLNKILAALPSTDSGRILGRLRVVSLSRAQVIQRQDERIEDVYFLDAGGCSLVRVLGDGSLAEVAMAGPENVIGANLYFGQLTSDCDVVVQIGSPVARVMRATAFHEEMERRGAFFSSVIRANQALTAEIIQTAACNGHHSAEQRCCRWLLTAHDHAGLDEFPLTHDIMASMLGLRRPTVTLVLMALRKAGVVHQRRGMMTIVDRDGLCERVCECYTTIRHQRSRLLPGIGDMSPADRSRQMSTVSGCDPRPPTWS